MRRCIATAFHCVLLTIAATVSAESVWVDLSANKGGSAHAQQSSQKGKVIGGQEYRANRCLEITDVTESVSVGKPNKRRSLRLNLHGYVKRLRQHRGQREVFDDISIWGCAKGRDIGKPAVPVKTLMLPIPHGVDAEAQVVSQKETIHENINMFPTQPPPQPGGPARDRDILHKDKNAYASSELYPRNNILVQSTVVMRDRRFLVVDITPVRVDAHARKMHVSTELNLVITLSTGEDPVPVEYLTSEYLSGDPWPTESGAAMFATHDAQEPPVYMILMDDKFSTNSTLATFVDWKRHKGFAVQTVTTSQIDAGGAPTHQNIVDYLRALPTADYPEYLLIIGNHTADEGVAAREVFPGETQREYAATYTDIDMTCRDNTDWVPDLFCGRLPVWDNDALSIVLQKILKLDHLDSTNALRDFDTTICSAAIEDSIDTPTNTLDMGFCQTHDAVSSYYETHGYNNLRVVGPDPVRSLDATMLWGPSGYELPFLWDGDTPIGQRIVDMLVDETTGKALLTNGLNNGAAMVHVFSHGWSQVTGYPQLTASNVTDLANGDDTFLFIANSCGVGRYYYLGTYAHALLENAYGGAYGMVAGTGLEWCPYGEAMQHGMMTGLMPDYASWQQTATNPVSWDYDVPSPGAFGSEGCARRLGEMVLFGKMYMLQNYGLASFCEKMFEIVHLFGDPEMYAQVFTNTPTSLSCHVPDQSIPPGRQEVTVDQLAEGVRVCLYSDEMDVHATGVVPEGASSLTFDITPVLSGSSNTIAVTVTDFGRIPYEDSITVERTRETDTNQGVFSM